MNDRTNRPDSDAQLARLAREHPGWECWKAISGKWYARTADESTYVRGATRADLSEQIRRAEQ